MSREVTVRFTLEDDTRPPWVIMTDVTQALSALPPDLKNQVVTVEVIVEAPRS